MNLTKRQKLLLFFALGGAFTWLVVVPEQQHLNRRHDASVCMRDLKDIGIAETQYVRDYDEKVPPASQWSLSYVPYILGQKYEGKQRELPGCPAAPNCKYAMNKQLSEVSCSDLADVTIIPSHFDSTTHKFNYADFGQSAPVPPRHERGNAIQYFDGHVKYRKTVDCSYVPEHIIRLGYNDHPYRLAELPRRDAPYEVNLLGILAEYKYENASQFYISAEGDTVKFYGVNHNIADRKRVEVCIRSLAPKWRAIRKMAGLPKSFDYTFVIQYNDNKSGTETIHIK